MPSDEEIARKATDMQKRARDVPLMQIPGYMEWSERKLDARESEALIAHMDAQAMWLLPEAVESVSTDIFDEMLEELKAEIDDFE